MPTEFVRCSAPGVEGTALLPKSALPYLPAWTPVDATSIGAEGTVEDVLADVADDPDKARAALLTEQASPKPRVTLVKRLSDIADNGQEA